MNAHSEKPSPLTSTPQPTAAPAPTADVEAHIKKLLGLQPVEPWPEPVDGNALLNELAAAVRSVVVMPNWGPETCALWLPHTYAFQLRDITTYLGLESPLHRCGKSTLITFLSEIAHLAIVASNVSSPAVYRAIDLSPSFFIDETDTFLPGNDELRGILNSGYDKKNAYVLRAANLPGPSNGNGDNSNLGLARYSCWCPKVIARIGRLPATLADRCIVFRMQRKTRDQKCDRLRSVDTTTLKRKCARFIHDHSPTIASARPEIPPELNDRAADIWEPLLVIADIAGGDWPKLARQAAVAVSSAADENTASTSLLLDLLILFNDSKADRLFSHDLVARLNHFNDRPWYEAHNGKPITHTWLAQQLNPYGVRPRNLRINGEQAKGYFYSDILEIARRYVTKADIEALRIEDDPPANPKTNTPPNQS